MLLTAFNALPQAESRQVLLACCAAPTWADAVTDGRPYRTVAALLARSEAALAALTDTEVRQVVASHPRIGERPGGIDRHSTWSRQEQAGVSSRLGDVLADANRRYEQRFGHVFLISAAGRTGPQIVAALERRLSHTATREQAVVRDELALITRRRMEGLVRP